MLPKFALPYEPQITLYPLDIVGIVHHLVIYMQSNKIHKVLLDTSSSARFTTYQSLRIQLVQNAPDDGPMRSETCRANISAE